MTLKGKYAETVLGYVNGIVSGKILAGKERIQGCKRFLQMIDSGEYLFPAHAGVILIV